MVEIDYYKYLLLLVLFGLLGFSTMFVMLCYFMTKTIDKCTAALEELIYSVRNAARRLRRALSE